MIPEHGRPADAGARTESERRVYDFLDRLGVGYDRVDHEPAMTMEACAAIDAMDMSVVVGTLAGDDTVLLVLAEDAQRYEVMQLVDEAVGQKIARRDGE